MAVLPIILTAIVTVKVVLVLATCPCCLVKTVIHLWPTLLRSASLDILFHNTFESTNTHSTLAMPSQCVVSSKRVAAETGIWLRASMDLCVALEVMATNKTLLAMIASELTIAQMCLDVGLDVLLPAKFFAAIFVGAHILAIDWAWSFDELCNVIDRNVGVLDRSFDAGLKVEICDRNTPG